MIRLSSKHRQPAEIKAFAFNGVTCDTNNQQETVVEKISLSELEQTYLGRLMSGGWSREDAERLVPVIISSLATYKAIVPADRPREDGPSTPPVDLAFVRTA